MANILRTADSRADVVDILLYIRRDNRRAARKVRDAIDETLDFLVEFPHVGTNRDELLSGMRSFPVKRYRNYVIFYRPRPDGIEVIRVLHGARDLRRQFRRPS
jgi:toxin ParE1/3/4